MPRIRRLLVGISTAALLISCTHSPPPRPASESILGWESVEAGGVGEDVEFALTLASPPMVPDRVGYIDLIGTDGSSRFIETEPHRDSKIAADDRRICAVSETATYELTPTSAQSRDRGGYAGVGLWTGAIADHACVVVLNSGAGPSGYETDVYWGMGTDQRHSVVPDIPEQAGYSDDAVWVRNGAVSDVPGVLHLYRTDLRTGRTATYMSWPTFSEPATGSREAIHFNDGMGTNLFVSNGTMYYVEDLTAVSDEGGRLEFRPGIHAELRLAEIDLARRTQKSHFLRFSPDGLLGPSRGGEEGMWSAVATSDGHLHDGHLYVTDSTGAILAIDVQKKKMSEVGRLSDAARRAFEIAAAWHDDKLTLLFIDERTHSATLETYSLRSGQREVKHPVDGVAELVDGGLYVGTLAKVG